MPVDSRELYFQLGLHADDDGVVEAYPVLKMLGCAEDNLRVLATKGFVIVIEDDDLISYITDWREHNHIRADRKIDSIHKKLLLKVVNDIELLESKPRADTGKHTGQPTDGQWTDNGQHRTGKVSIGEVREGEESIDIIDIVANHWNDKKPLQTSAITTINRHIQKKHRDVLNDLGEEQAKKSIDNYTEILSNDIYYFSHSWSLWDFIVRGMEKFIDEAKPHQNYITDKASKQDDKYNEAYL